MSDVTASTKCWDADYREVLSPIGIEELFGPLGPVARRQVVLNRIDDRADAERRAASLVADGLLDDWGWAEDAWPAVADRLGIPLRWFGPAWPYSAPELCELAMCPTRYLAHVAGDVAIRCEAGWLDSAVGVLAGAPKVAAVSPTSPHGVAHLVNQGAMVDRRWIRTTVFSDQCFVVRPDQLFRPEVVRAAGAAVSPFPKPGGALTLEARVTAWMDREGYERWSDSTAHYDHPVRGREGATHGSLYVEPLASLPALGRAYPPTGSVEGTGLIIVRDGERHIGEAVRSLAWLRKTVVVDHGSVDRSAARAREAGAEVIASPDPSSAREGLLENIRHETLASFGRGWVVMLDADEVCPARLAREFARRLADAKTDGVRVPRANYFGGAWIRTGGAWPDHQLRAFRNEKAITNPHIHEQIRLAPDAVITTLPEDFALAITHFNYTDLHDWIERTNRYTSLHARSQHLDRNVSLRAGVRAFLRSYLRERGFRQGRAGFRASVRRAAYDFLLVEKWAELVDGGATAILAGYDELAAQILTDGTP